MLYITIHLDDLEVRVTDLEALCLIFAIFGSMGEH